MELRGASIPLFNADDQDSLFTFDDNGNPTTYSGSSLGYDPENHLDAIGSSWSAGYIANGLRAWKTSAGNATWFLYDGDQPIVETDGNGNVTAVNTFGANGLYWTIFRSSSAPARPFDVLNWSVYIGLLCIYAAFVRWRRPLGIAAVVVHLVGWAWVPVELFLGLPV